MQVALAWLLQRPPNMLMLSGTSSVNHLRENLAAAALRLPPETVADLDLIAGGRDLNVKCQTSNVECLMDLSNDPTTN
jgi:aryl-alcohol dehydrogenase-like predicted oxidoreductase